MSEELTKVAGEAARGGFFLFAGNALSTIILAIGSIIVARLLGPEAYGLYAISLVAPGLLLLFTDFGVSAAVTMFSAKLRAEGKAPQAAGMLRSAILFKLLTATAMFALCLILSETLAARLLNRPGIGPLVRLVALSIPFQAVFATASSAFLGLDRMQDNALTLNIQSIVKAASAPVLLLLGFGVVGALTGYVLGYAAAGASALAILFLKHYRSLGGAEKGDSLGENLRAMMGYGLPLYASALLGSLLAQYQSIILAQLTSNIDIGNLNVAMQFATLIGVLTSPMAVLFPAFSKLNPEGREAKRLYGLSVKYTALLIVPAAVAIAILSRDLIFAIYGPSYSLAPLLLSTYAMNFLFSGIGSLVIGNLLSGAGETKLILKANLINLAVFAPLAPVLILTYGVLGAVLAGLASTLASLAYQLLAARKRLGVGFNPSASLKIYLASILSAAPILLFLQLSPFQGLANVIFGGCLFLLAYLTASPLLGAVRMSDIENLKLILGRLKIARLLNPILAYEAKLASR